MKKFCAFILVFSISSLTFLSSSLSSDLSFDISNNQISINSNFTGAEILLFGKISKQGDIIIVVEGPKEQLSVRKKKRVVGIWINTKTLYFSKVPAYYAVLSNKPLREITSEENINKLITKPDLIKLTNNNVKISNSDLQLFKNALARNKNKQNLYNNIENAVSLNDKLFRSWIKFPANAPEGNYTINTYLFSNYDLVNTKKTSLIVNKVGIDRQIYDFANNKPTLYGLTAIIIAILAGWAAALIFRQT